MNNNQDNSMFSSLMAPYVAPCLNCYLVSFFCKIKIKKRILTLFLTILSVIVFWPVVTLAASSSDDPQLKAVQQQIDQTKESVQQNKQYINQLQQQLKKQDINIANGFKDLKKLRLETKTIDSQIAKIKQQQDQLLKQKKEQQKSLAKLVQQQYQLSQHNQLTNLLSGQATEQIDRLFIYAEIISNKKLEVVRKLNENSVQVQYNYQQLNIKKEEKTKRYDEQLSDQRRLQVEQVERKQTIIQIKKELSTDQGYLKELQNNEQQFTLQLAAIKKQQAVKTENTTTSSSANVVTNSVLITDKQTTAIKNSVPLKDFVKMQGLLPWPVTGKILHSYGSTKVEGLNWKGIVISGNVGASIRAVSAGKVIFSDWLRGYGLVIILDHGNDYLTLYGYNQVLEKNVGDSVAAGDIIATMGSSGGQDSASLYFEIRSKGATVDPKMWLKAGRR